MGGMRAMRGMGRGVETLNQSTGNPVAQIDLLTQRSILHQDASGERWYASRKKPQNQISLRGGGVQLVIIDNDYLHDVDTSLPTTHRLERNLPACRLARSLPVRIYCCLFCAILFRRTHLVNKIPEQISRFISLFISPKVFIRRKHAPIKNRHRKARRFT